MKLIKLTCHHCDPPVVVAQAPAFSKELVLSACLALSAHNLEFHWFTLKTSQEYLKKEKV